MIQLWEQTGCHINVTQHSWAGVDPVGGAGPSSHTTTALLGSRGPPLQGEALTGTLSGLVMCGNAGAETGRASHLLLREGRGFGNRNTF